MLGAATGLLISRLVRKKWSEHRPRDASAILRVHILCAVASAPVPSFVSTLVIKLRSACPNHEVRIAAKNPVFDKIHEQLILVSYGPSPCPLTNFVVVYHIGRSGMDHWTDCGAARIGSPCLTMLQL